MPSNNGHGPKDTFQKAIPPEEIRILIKSKLITTQGFTLQELGVLVYILAAVSLNTETPEKVTPRSVVEHFDMNQPLAVAKALETLHKKGYITDDQHEIPALLEEFGNQYSV